jgi:beta-lactamase regulating signal transducer with metallopeptidase domain/thiol-disulfide isomerase/thioredoxin
MILARESTVPIHPVPAVAYSTEAIRPDQPAPAPTSAEAQGFRWGNGLVSWLWSIWLAGVLVLTARLILGSLALARVVRRSLAVPDGIVGECRTIAERLRCRGPVRVRRTSEIATPCLAGLRRPVLLLPERECEDGRPDDLRAILAHELAHARNHDLAWNLAAHVASILLWFHPLVWRIRAAHAAECDAVCDAVAADLLGDVASYGRTLARLAVRAAWPASAHGLAMARTSDVRRRLDALSRKVFRSPLSRRRVMPALCVGSLLLLLIGGFGVTYAGRSGDGNGTQVQKVTEPANDAPGAKSDDPARFAAKPKAGQLILQAVAAGTNEPIEGVSISYRGRFGEESQHATVITGEDGTAAIEWAPGATVHRLWFTASAPKLVPIHVSWSDERHPLELPALKELRFEPGTLVGGIVRDEGGHPIVGATVEVNGLPTEYEGSNSIFSIGETKTDARGRWSLDIAPKDVSGVWVFAKDARYRPRAGENVASLGRDSVIVLKKGLTVTGQVVDAAGRPAKGARAEIGHDIWGTSAPTATTDEKGAFTLENCDRGPTIVTVQAEGFAPRIRDVLVEERTPSVEIRLTEPASIVRGKVLDIGGKPVAGAFVAADTWRGHRSIRFRVNTDQDGRFVWQSAPKDVVLYDMGHEDYMASRQVSLTASDQEHVITLYPKLMITGRVTDAETGHPVLTVRVVRGRRFEERGPVHWLENESVDVKGGQYAVQFDEPSEALFVRVEAPGHKTAESRAFRPSEGRQTLDFRLTLADGHSGLVLLPDGRPAPGAEVVLATRQNHVELRSGRFDRGANAPRFTTGPDGRFAFTPPLDRFLLIAVSDAGYADASSSEFAKSGKLVLQPWGRIEGGARIGPRFGSNEEVSFNPTRPDRGGGSYVFTYGYSARTDDRGRFTFERVIPGPGTVSRVIRTEFPGGSTMHMPCWLEPVEVKPGQASQVTIGGKGRPVVGRVVLDGVPEAPVDWTQNIPATITARHEGRGARDFVRRFGSNIDKDGRFRIEDVTPGDYELDVDVNPAADPQFSGPATRIGNLKVPVTVPEIPGGRTNEPLDLGTITAKLFETLKAGDLAPDFTVQQIGAKDRRLKLSEFDGRLVLLNFWATWCGPCLAEMPALKDIQAAFGTDPRFKLISLSCDQTAGLAERFIEHEALSWTQGFAGSLVSGAGADYKIRILPATFLIGPDGRIVAKNLRGPALKDAIRKALADDKVFAQASRAARPGRFPVTRFDVPGEKPGETPLVVVLDDCDEDFNEIRPHHDALRILSKTDSGVRASLLREFNTCQTVGAVHGVAVDAARGRIYLCEQVSHRVTAVDFRGRKLWQVGQIRADALAVDSRTGNLWCCVGQDLAHGETVVLDTTGREVASFPFRGIDIAYDSQTDGFWLVGYGITKLSREGNVIFQKPHEGWACVSVAVNPGDGSAWIVERGHPDVAQSVNRLWHLGANGTTIKMWELGEKRVFGVACEPKTGTAWVVSLGSEVLRFTADGRELPPLSVKARAISISPTTGRVWATTEIEVLQLDGAAQPKTVSRFEAKSGQSWLAAF